MLVYLLGRFWSHLGRGDGYGWHAGVQGTPKAGGSAAGMFNLWL
jgi:hypothetical protein